MDKRLYLYCIIDGVWTGNPFISDVTKTPVFGIDYKEICAIVSAANDRIYRADIEILEAHEKVIESFLDEHTALPAQYSSVFNNEEVLMQFLDKYYDQFMENISMLKNKVEMGLKIFSNISEIRKSIEDKVKGSGFLEKCSPGKKYMMDRFKRYQVKSMLEEIIWDMVKEIHEQCSSLAVHYTEKILPMEDMLLSSAYLIRKKDIDKFFYIVKDYKEKNKRLRVYESGPWPPYNFVKLTKEGG